MKGSVSKIETFGLVDGPGIRTVVFLSGCKLRCKYCHNPEMWQMGDFNYTPEELADRIIRNKAYFKNGGGVTFSGGEALLQDKFLIAVMKILKDNDIHIALDTAGVGNGNYEDVLKYVDLIIFDVKFCDALGYKELTDMDIDESMKFLEVANKMNKEFIVRQVIIPELNDNESYLKSLSSFIHKNIKNVSKIEFLPYHKMGDSKYISLGINNPYHDKVSMDAVLCDDLYKKFMNIYNS